MALQLPSEVDPRWLPACRRARVVWEHETLPSARQQKRSRQDAVSAAALCDLVADPESGITAASVVSGRDLVDAVEETAAERGLAAERSTAAKTPATAPRAIRIFRR